MARREKRALENQFGLANFGVNLTRLAPGAMSVLRHANSLQDKLVYILSGDPTLITDSGSLQLNWGMCAGFKARTSDGHHLVNETDQVVEYLELGDRMSGDSAQYPDDDILAIYSSTHRIKFSDLDPYKYMRTAMYSAYYVAHRMSALREQAGWDLKTLESLSFMAFVRRQDIEFIRSVVGDQRVSIASFVREFSGPDAHVECNMSDEAGTSLSKCHMVAAYADKSTNKSADWPDDVMDLFFE